MNTQDSNKSSPTIEADTEVPAEKPYGSGSDEPLQPRQEQDEHQPQDPDIDGGYAWVICFACLLLNFNIWGGNSGFAVYFSTYLSQNTFEGATKMDFAYIGGLAIGVGFLFAPVINALLGLIGFRGVLIVGNCLQFTSLMLASWSTKLWQLYLTQGLMQSFGLAFLAIPASTIIPQYFKKKRVLAGGIATAGSGLGGIVYNLAMQKVVDTRGVHWALRTQGIMEFGMVWIAIALVRSKAKQHSIEFKLVDHKVLRTAPFWLLSFFIVTCMFGYVIVLYTLANFTTSLGYSGKEGSYVAAMVQVGSAVGRPTVGYISDRFGGITVAAAGYYIVGIFCLAMWIPARNLATIIIFGLISGSMMGAVYGMIAPAISRSFGLLKMNVVASKVYILLGVSGLFSPVIGVALIKGEAVGVDPTRYVYCSVFTGVSFVVCASTLLVLRGYIKARDHLMEKDGHTDSDLADYTGVTVPFTLVFANIFAKSNEKV
ncbi:putative transporter MCH2 [Candida viswanathii]|uniref:Putative transporter MCH2 n=1 Tax=Candida viswanathii TaxID=5486 RepID=A0A367Y4C0_9ASCO|nr:putative transporter MCH2 [Candida viswanathii]